MNFIRTTYKTPFILDSYCFNARNCRLFTGRCIETAILLLLPCVYSVAGCLLVRNLATLWPSTLQYTGSDLMRHFAHKPLERVHLNEMFCVINNNYIYSFQS
jgi:hypothetical protein